MQIFSDQSHFQLNPMLGAQLAELAEQRHQSVAVVMEDLLREALELQEDAALSKLADARLATATEWVSHADAWK